MSDFTPSTPIELQIRKIIFEKFNDVNKKFTNDEVFEILKSNGDVNPSWIIDDTESLFNDICDSRLVRSIAQNFTTIFLKLFELVEKFHCNSCNYDIHLGISEEKICPNPSCRSTL
ncbi:MAG: hypothetical protein MT332_04965 [Candidatus Nitrosopumilus limneticus]|nr:hypothetical protein [Candidatus Nitrosopumilus limneticus]